MSHASPAVDAYIAKAAPFAQPILKKVRGAFHKGCPDLEERLKWGVPSFEYKGLMGGMAAFKAHVAWGFWRHKEMADPRKIFQGDAMMSGGKIVDADQLPPETVMVEYVKRAAKLNDAGPVKRAATAKAKPPVKVPSSFAKVLKRNPKALATFEGFAPSHKREYVEWIVEAKQEATRERRIATAIEWLVKGKSRNWKYEKC